MTAVPLLPPASPRSSRAPLTSPLSREPSQHLILMDSRGPRFRPAFSNFNLYTHHGGILFKCRLGSFGLRMGPRSLHF